MQRRLGTTTVYVTHDQTEAMTLGDRVALMRRGELQQVGTPRELYEHPVNMFVAGFIGSPPMNFVPGVVSGGSLQLPFVTVDLPDDMREAVGDRDLVMVGIRPERFDDESLVDPSKAAGGTAFDAEIDVVEWLGNEQYAYIPYSTTADAVESLAALERDLDSERLRNQLVVALDPSSRISDRQHRTHLVRPTTPARLRSLDRRQPHPRRGDRRDHSRLTAGRGGGGEARRGHDGLARGPAPPAVDGTAGAAVVDTARRVGRSEGSAP